MTNVPLRNGAFSGVFRDLLSVDIASLDAGNLAFHVKTLRGDDVVEGPIRRCSQQPYDGMLSSVLSGVQAKKTTGAACFVSATSNLASRQIKFVAECAGLTSTELRIGGYVSISFVSFNSSQSCSADRFRGFVCLF